MAIIKTKRLAVVAGPSVAVAISLAVFVSHLQNPQSAGRPPELRKITEAVDAFAQTFREHQIPTPEKVTGAELVAGRFLTNEDLGEMASWDITFFLTQLSAPNPSRLIAQIKIPGDATFGLLGDGSVQHLRDARINPSK